jgi:hypothetical protein
MEKIKISRHPVFKDFGILKTISGTYICPGWIPVPSGTTREDIEFSNDIIIKPVIVSAEVKPVLEQIYKVLSSNGKQTYTIKNNKGDWSCTCPASNFRRGDCKHIKSFKN